VKRQACVDAAFGTRSRQTLRAIEVRKRGRVAARGGGLLSGAHDRVGNVRPASTNFITSGVLCTALLLSLSHCASRPIQFAGKPVKKPIAVVLRVSDQAAKANDMGGIAAIVDAVTDRLTEEGLAHRLYLEDGAAPEPPRVDIDVVLWNPGDEELRRQGTAVGLLGPLSLVGGGVGLAMTAASVGSVIVDCQGYAEGATKPTYQARFQQHLVSLDVDGQQSAGSRIGARIGTELINGVSRQHPIGP